MQYSTNGIHGKSILICLPPEKNTLKIHRNVAAGNERRDLFCLINWWRLSLMQIVQTGSHNGSLGFVVLTSVQFTVL